MDGEPTREEFIAALEAKAATDPMGAAHDAAAVLLTTLQGIYFGAVAEHKPTLQRDLPCLDGDIQRLARLLTDDLSDAAMLLHEQPVTVCDQEAVNYHEGILQWATTLQYRIKWHGTGELRRMLAPEKIDRQKILDLAIAIRKEAAQVKAGIRVAPQPIFQPNIVVQVAQPTATPKAIAKSEGKGENLCLVTLKKQQLDKALGISDKTRAARIEAGTIKLHGEHKERAKEVTLDANQFPANIKRMLLEIGGVDN